MTAIRLGALERKTGLAQDEQFLLWLRERRHEGVHTFEMREAFVANPGERVAELRRGGNTLVGRVEKLRGDARGKRWWLAKYAPADLRPIAGRAVSAAASRPPVLPTVAPVPLRPVVWSAPENARVDEWVTARRAAAAAAAERALAHKASHTLAQVPPTVPPTVPAQIPTASATPTAGRGSSSPVHHQAQEAA